ncbi:hypothetical protein DNK47_02975 [Mycoplasma wenyonii]|uniref:Uncharacterized protein n=1 Tax=Mycoplasma wenyonii TaxID=65123 RepID=A0A328PP86_9MOLU|nr:hypothetical protein DNK47_02975 [Mycoplasma wenyonii]
MDLIPVTNKLIPEINPKTISVTEFLKDFYSDAEINDSSNPLTIIAKWDEWAFIILQWDTKCQYFRQLNKNIGLHINSKGLFTIGTKYDSQRWLDSNKPNCSNFNGFWWQEWNTWWRTRSYLGVSDQEIGKNKLTKANCSKYPVVVIEKEDEIPYFYSISKEPHLTPDSEVITSRNIYWDNQTKTFVGQRDFPRKRKNLYFIKNYGDYSQFVETIPSK